MVFEKLRVVQVQILYLLLWLKYFNNSPNLLITTFTDQGVDQISSLSHLRVNKED